MAGIKLSGNRYRTIVIQIYIFIMFSIYPLIYHNFYYDIVTCKFIFFMITTGILSVILLFLMPDNYFHDFSIKNIKLTECDYFIIGFFIVNVISVILSDNSMYAITGAEGRNMGLLSIAAVTVLFFVISRNYEENNIFYYILCCGSTCVSVLGILNFLNIDILGFYNGLTHAQKLNYISTLGHIDVYTCYFALSIPVLYIVYLMGNSMKLRILSCVSLVINICGMWAGQCDTGYIIMLLSMIISVVLIKGQQRYSVFILPVIISLIIIRIMFVLNNKSIEKREISRFAKYVCNNAIWMIVVIIFAICLIVESYKVESYKKVNTPYIWKTVLVILLAGVLLYISAVCVFTFAFKDVNLGSMEGILRFSDSFGSYRGYIWKLLIKDYSEMNIVNKLVGIGTDSMRPYVVEKYGESMYVVTNAYYDNAHNELIQYLITTGITGLVMYIGLIVCSIRNGIKAHRIIYLGPVICYVVQSLVNINQVVTTPLFFIILGIINSKENNLS